MAVFTEVPQAEAAALVARLNLGTLAAFYAQITQIFTDLLNSFNP